MICQRCSDGFTAPGLNVQETTTHLSVSIGGVMATVALEPDVERHDALLKAWDACGVSIARQVRDMHYRGELAGEGDGRPTVDEG